jgi:uncharacterized protein involved in exopolysaccharide biosynthesis
MRSLVRWAARLYPAAWRARYGVEMEALLEDVGPGGGDLWDIVRGALFMQMTSLSFWKILAGCTLAGVLAAGVWSAVLPKRYVSTAVIRIRVAGPSTEAEAKWAAFGRVQAVLSRSSLATIIGQQNLYTSERRKYPMEEVTQEMRNRHLRIGATPDAMAFTVSYENENPAAAQATLRAIVSSLAEQDAQPGKRQGNAAAVMEVLDPASLPSQAAGSDRKRELGSGLAAGLALGLVSGTILAVARRKGHWNLRWIGGFAAAGMAIGLAIALLIPNEYVSTAVLRSAAEPSRLQATLPQVLSEDSLAAIVREYHLYSRELIRSSMHDVVGKMRNERIRVSTLQLQPSGAAFTISFRYSDRLMAQRVTRELVARLITGIGAPQTGTVVLDPASLPEAPSYPHRGQIAILGTLVGTLVGLLLGLGATQLRLRRPATV